MKTVADLAADYRPGHDFNEGGIADTAGDGEWLYLSSSAANPSEAGAMTAALAYGSVGDAGNQGYGGGQNGYNLAAISDEYVFADGGGNGDIQGSTGYHELALHPAGTVDDGGPFEGEAAMPYVVARWTAGASSAGLANINGSIRNYILNNDSVDFHIYVDGDLQFTAAGLDTYLVETYFDFDTELAEGSTVDFVLGNNGTGNLYGDESWLRATILALDAQPIPEPSSVVLTALLCAILFGSRRQRRGSP